jgi:hypothetical protein
MNNSEYFTKIGEKVHERRKKSEYSREEMRIFREGKKQAYKDVIAMFIAAHTSAKKKKEFVGIFEKEGFTPEELCHFCELEVKYFSDGLKKALRRCAQQEKTLALFSQLQI